MIEGKNILIVDDDRLNVLALSAFLRSKKPNIFIAYNGLECLEQLENNPNINLILLDLMMPELDGYKTLELIKQKDNIKNIPVIIVTARVIRGEKQKFLLAGANEYIEKPIDFDSLLKSISFLCN